MGPIQLSPRIIYLPATHDPLSADVIAVRGDSAWWIYDVGNSDDALGFINGLDGSLMKNIVISHFHVDHTGNLLKALRDEVSLPFDQLYVGQYTFRHTHQGNVISHSLEIEDGIRLLITPVPSSHAKGSLVLVVGDEIAFMGDSTYPKVGHGEPDSYNVQTLYEQIKFLSSMNVKSLYLSHKKGLRRDRESVVSVLKNIYERRRRNENEIFMA